MRIFEQLNIPKQCKKYGLSLWQCPSFLFLIMGIIIALVSVLSYLIGTRYVTEPRIVALIVLIISAILLILATIITNSFEKLAEANRMKSEFISIVSHQLRAPLSNLAWAIELLMSGRLGKIEEQQVEYFKILKENSDRMKDLVKDLLIVSRIESARLFLKREEFSLEELVREIIKEFEPFAKASNCEIEFFVEENLPKIYGDRYQIRQVIENLLDNAIRYTKGKGKVKVRIKKEKKFVRFEIEDNGVGIPKEDQKFIFQKFFRASNVLKYKTQGTGLGLYISKAIIERSGGKIGFKSQEGVGSTFWFKLPIK
jgi:signal transduction histidine kinase